MQKCKLDTDKDKWGDLQVGKQNDYSDQNTNVSESLKLKSKGDADDGEPANFLALFAKLSEGDGSALQDLDPGKPVSKAKPIGKDYGKVFPYCVGTHRVCQSAKA